MGDQSRSRVSGFDSVCVIHIHVRIHMSVSACLYTKTYVNIYAEETSNEIQNAILSPNTKQLRHDQQGNKFFS